MSDTVTVNLPFFPGFYESQLSGLLDHAEEREAEYAAERDCDDSDEQWPDELSLDADEHGSALWESMNYSAAHDEIARDYCEAFDNWARDNIGTPEGAFTFESMSSPRYYNFDTDRVFVTVPRAVMESLYAGIDRAALAALIDARHSSSSGFHSFYSNDIADWEDKGFDEFDHNEYGTILCAAIPRHEFDNWDVTESLHECDYEYVDKHCDWSKHAEKVAAMRAEKLATWIRDDVDAAARWIDSDSRAPALVDAAADELSPDDVDSLVACGVTYAESHYRCPYTLELPL